jgi:hypothetical protein
LKLNNVKTVNARAESLPETFDYIVSRAVTSLENFMPWVKGKYDSGILYLKGGDLAEEISTAMAKYKMRKGSVHIIAGLAGAQGLIRAIVVADVDHLRAVSPGCGNEAGHRIRKAVEGVELRGAEQGLGIDHQKLHPHFLL